MKNIFSHILLCTVMALSFTACLENDDLEFIVKPPNKDAAFSNSFLSEYTLTRQTSENIAERFVWHSVVFEGTPTAVTYDIQYSTSQNFENFNSLGTTEQTNLAVTVETLLMVAESIGLDNNPNSEAPNIGSIFFRLRAFVGNGGTDAPESISTPQKLVMVLPEIMEGSGVELSSWGIVGSGYNEWGATADAPFYTTNESGIFVSYVTLKDGEIKFRENNDWSSNLGDNDADGTIEPEGANIISTAGTYKITLNTNDNTYAIEEYSWGIVGSGYNEWGATPDAPFYYDYTTNTFKAGVKLKDGEIKFRLNNAWDINYGGANGTLLANGDNISSIAGFYEITIDFENNTYTIEPVKVWGIVGSGYNDWGNARPDYNFTQVNSGIYEAIVTLLDGEIKFRQNEDWGINYGDDNADGSLEEGGANIPSTAGKYRIVMNLTDSSNPFYTLSAL